MATEREKQQSRTNDYRRRIAELKARKLGLQMMVTDAVADIDKQIADIAGYHEFHGDGTTLDPRDIPAAERTVAS